MDVNKFSETFLSKVDGLIPLPENLIDISVLIDYIFYTPPKLRTILSKEGGIGGGISYKAKNVYLNTDKFFKALLAGSFAFVKTTPKDDLYNVIILIILIQIINDALTVKISEVEASVFWAMWIHKSYNKTVIKEKVSEHVREEREKFMLRPLEESEIEKAISNLLDIKAIYQNHGNCIFLQEHFFGCL